MNQIIAGQFGKLINVARRVFIRQVQNLVAVAIHRMIRWYFFRSLVFQIVPRGADGQANKDGVTWSFNTAKEWALNGTAFKERAVEIEVCRLYFSHMFTWFKMKGNSVEKINAILW